MQNWKKLQNNAEPVFKPLKCYICQIFLSQITNTVTCHI